RTPPTTTTIDRAEELVAIFEELQSTGSGWLNIVPELPEGTEVPATPNSLAIFSRRGPVVPLATWTTTEPTELGLLHGTSQRARFALADTVAAIPDGWRVLADHPRKGLVVVPGAGLGHRVVARWLLDALTVLCLPPHTGRFVVARYPG
ncbi:MAG TPA: hypothetical protein PLP95_04235, partial [Microthrixaceae bacterium]|nr:hypothetical protein [Microthrixaceae bacterium]